ncbi:MAG: hypothetical protein MJ154_02225 [Candidatus Saccharibacteria bacterium]|nr:hypothetical protein [Candidatus Saccharibacteria bacterium]
MVKNKKQNKKTASKDITIFILAVLLVAAITFGVVALIKQSQPKETGEKDSAQDKNTASEILKTEEDLKDEDKVAESSNDAKDRMEADEKVKVPAEIDESGLIIAKPEISFVAEEGDKIAAGGAIYNINESEGTCTYVFSKGDSTITASTKILPNPGYISCETARIERSKFTSGTWSVKIQYKSKTAEGESETQTYTIK